MKYAAFISHAGEEKKLAIKIVRILEASGLSCWISRRDIAAGDVYGKDIINALESSHICILILSRLSNTKPGVHNEVERAFSKRIPIICLRVENVKPSKELEYFISSVQWIDAWENQFNHGINYLKLAMRKHLPGDYQPGPIWEADKINHESLFLKCIGVIRKVYLLTKIYLLSQNSSEAASGSVRLSGRGQIFKIYSVTIPPPEKVRSVILGRSPGDPRGLIAHDEITRKHAVLTWLNGDLCICDNESLNGTFVNGIQLKGDSSIALRDGDRVQLGPVRMRVKFV